MVYNAHTFINFHLCHARQFSKCKQNYNYTTFHSLGAKGQEYAE